MMIGLETKQKSRLPTIDTYNRDSDEDGYPDRNDDFPNDASEWNDADEDGLGDNSDDCVYSMASVGLTEKDVLTLMAMDGAMMQMTLTMNPPSGATQIMMVGTTLTEDRQMLV